MYDLENTAFMGPTSFTNTFQKQSMSQGVVL